MQQLKGGQDIDPSSFPMPGDEGEASEEGAMMTSTTSPNGGERKPNESPKLRNVMKTEGLQKKRWELEEKQRYI